MIYIPTPWLINPNNEDKVRELLENLNQDLITNDLLKRNQVIKELEKLGETNIIEKLENNEIPLGA